MSARFEHLFLASKRTIMACVWLTIGVFWLFFGPVIIFSRLDKPTDFSVYYAAGESLRFSAQAPIYQWQTLAHTIAIHGGCPLLPHIRYLYPPLLAIVLAPLTRLPCQMLLLVWHVGNLALLCVATLLFVALLRSWWPAYDSRRLAALVILATACWLPLMWGIWLAQVSLIVLTGLVLSLWLIERGHPVLAGVTLALIALIQLLPSVVIVHYALRRQWHVVAGCVVAGLLAISLMLVVVGVPGLLAMFDIFLSANASKQSDGNVALFIVPVLGPLLTAAILLSFVAGILRYREASWRLTFGWATCTMLLVTPLAWGFFLTWLLPVFAICLAGLPRGATARAIYAALLLLIYLLGDVSASIPYAATAALVSLWLVCGSLVRESRRRHDAHVDVVGSLPAPDNDYLDPVYAD